MGACPYHARYFNWWDPVWPEGMEKYLSPNVSPRMRGVVEKCSLCYHRYQLARDKAIYEERDDIEEEEYQTACTQACPAGAIVFGDLNNPHHAVHQIVKPIPHEEKHKGILIVGRSQNPLVFRILERLGTNSKIYYMSSREWVRKAGDNYLPGEFEEGKTNKVHA